MQGQSIIDNDKILRGIFEMSEKKEYEMNTEEVKGETNENTEDSQMMWLPIGMCLGVSIGMAMGSLLFDNMSLGMCIGLALGVSAGSIIDALNRKKGAQNEQEKY